MLINNTKNLDNKLKKKNVKEMKINGDKNECVFMFRFQPRCELGKA